LRNAGTDLLHLHSDGPASLGGIFAQGADLQADVRLAAISECFFRMTESYPFRPRKIILPAPAS
jgi:hypothetical protein